MEAPRFHGLYTFNAVAGYTLTDSAEGQHAVNPSRQPGDLT
jgi:hypothetical protein